MNRRIRIAVVAAVAAVIAMFLAPQAEAAAYVRFAAGYCNAAAEGASWFGKTSALFPASSCYEVRARAVYRPVGTSLTVYGAWRVLRPSTLQDAAQVVVATIDTTRYTMLRTQHYAEDRSGHITLRTCYPTSGSCVSGLR